MRKWLRSRSTTSPPPDITSFPLCRRHLRDHGNYIISINKFVKWLAAKVEAAGITIFTGFAGSELLFADDGVAGCAHRG